MRTEALIERRNGFLEGAVRVLRSRLGNILLYVNLSCIGWWYLLEWATRPEYPLSYHVDRPPVLGVAVVVYVLLATPTWVAMWLLGTVLYPLLAPLPGADDEVARAAFVVLSSAQWLLVGRYVETRRVRRAAPRLSVVPEVARRHDMPAPPRPLGIF